MLPVTTVNAKGKSHQGRRAIRYPGITRDARSLGVAREHLWQVLTGRRKSRSLLKRYRALKHEQKLVPFPAGRKNGTEGGR